MSKHGSSQPHVLVVDDDKGVRWLLRACLENDGFAVSEAADSAGMRACLASGGVDLVTLDLMLGSENGLVLAASIGAGRDIPVVMITAKSETIDRVVGLEIGADDYISKPFHPREVVARVRAVLRRTSISRSTTAAASRERWVFGAWVMDLGQRELVATPHAIRDLTTAEFNLLEAFVRRPKRVMSRDALMDILKGHDWTPMDRSIDALISRLRRKIEVDPENPKFIKTVRGIGYVFACDVRPA